MIPFMIPPPVFFLPVIVHPFAGKRQKTCRSNNCPARADSNSSFPGSSEITPREGDDQGVARLVADGKIAPDKRVPGARDGKESVHYLCEQVQRMALPIQIAKRSFS